LDDREQLTLKNVLHVLYKSFKLDKETGTGVCRVGNVSRETLGCIIAIHDRIVDKELKDSLGDTATGGLLERAIDYVKQNLEQEDIEVIRAQVDRSFRYQMNPSSCVTDEARVRDLLNEYGRENSMEEDWWEDHADIDEILLKI
jgi:hypothetical protein